MDNLEVLFELQKKTRNRKIVLTSWLHLDFFMDRGSCKCILWQEYQQYMATKL